MLKNYFLFLISFIFFANCSDKNNYVYTASIQDDFNYVSCTFKNITECETFVNSIWNKSNASEKKFVWGYYFKEKYAQFIFDSNLSIKEIKKLINEISWPKPIKINKINKFWWDLIIKN